MAKYTTQVRSIVESGTDLFDFDYPIFDVNYKSVLETKIIEHYYFREIGLETVGQFKWFLKSKMNRIMPYYNQLYTSENLITKDDYMINQNSVETHTKTVTEEVDRISATTGNTTNTGTVGIVGNTTNTGTVGIVGQTKNTGTSTDAVLGTETTVASQLFSDTPQAKLNGLDYATNLTDNDNNVSTDTTNTKTNNLIEDNTGTTTNNLTEGTTGTTTNNLVEDNIGELHNTGTITTIEDYTIALTGGGGLRYNADILMEWRKSFLNIDQEIIDELQDLFMNVY